MPVEGRVETPSNVSGKQIVGMVRGLPVLYHSMLPSLLDFSRPLLASSSLRCASANLASAFGSLVVFGNTIPVRAIDAAVVEENERNAACRHISHFYICHFLC